MATFELIKNAHVDVTSIINENKAHVAEIVVNGKYTHRFSASSRVSRHLDTMTAKELGSRLSGGAYFFVEDELVDWRDGTYDGSFIHSDKAIGKFMDVLGVTTTPIARRKAERLGYNSQIELKRVWSDLDFNAPHIIEGGDFKSRLTFEWSPFNRTINSTYELVRLVCTNGMIGTTSWLNNKVPVINKWEEHLQIANDQIQHKVQQKFLQRMTAMTKRRASVADCQSIASHAIKRISSPHNDAQQRLNLQRIGYVADVEEHLNSYYKSNVFEDKHVAAQCPSHLTQFDVYNLATEISSHTEESKDSSNFALHRLANFLLFDEDQDYTASRFGSPKLSQVSDPSVAYFGALA